MSRENVEVVRLWWEGLSEHGMPPRDLSDESMVIRNVAETPLQGPYRGYEGACQWAADIFEVVEQARFKLEESIDVGDGERVVTMQRLLGEAAHTRLDIDYLWAAVWTIRNGRILSAQGYATRSEALEAVGLSE